VSVPAEFGRIAQHFAPLAAPGGLGLRDDAALLTPPPGRELVLTADTMVEGVHYLPGEPAENVARKLLRVNLSDLAAMGATPLHYLLALSVPRTTPDAWFASFAHGLALDQAQYGVTLLGGDSTSTPGPITLTVTMLGHVAPGAAWRRAGAQPGDDVYVTGIVGRGVLGLDALLGKQADPDGTLAAHYRLPHPRLGLPLHGLVHAAMDISDGLVQDSGHMARASNLALVLHPGLVPLCPAGRAAGPAFVTSGRAGGDDYELLLAVPPSHASALQAAMHTTNVPVTRIGRFAPGAPGVHAIAPDGTPVDLGTGGWSHF
jgi:thiamine-monophosphate kinase